MSNRVKDSVLRELDLLAALDSVKAKIDTSAITEIQDWSRAVIGKFYGATVEHALQAANRPSESSAIADLPMAISMPSLTPHVTSEGIGHAQLAAPQLISICVSTGDETAWGEFVRGYQPLIAGVISRYVRRMGNISHELVEELVQEVYVKLCANNFYALKSFGISHENALFGFLKVIASNVAQDYFRTARSLGRSGSWGRGHELNAQLKEFSDVSDSSTALDRELLIQKIEQQLQTYSEEPNFIRDHTIFWLYYKSGLTAKAISHLPEMGLSVKGIESILHRMTRQIRANLASPASERKKKNNL